MATVDDAVISLTMEAAAIPTMKEAMVYTHPGIHVSIEDVPIPTPQKHEILIRVMAAASNRKDFSHVAECGVARPTGDDLAARVLARNSGDDLAGRVQAMGRDVVLSGEFRVGDAVAAFHPIGSPGGAYAQYAVAPAHTVFKLPAGMAFTEGATIPLTVATAGVTLYRRQFLPPPWAPRPNTSPPIPLIIYGASSAVGTFAVKLARASNIHPIIAIVGGSYTDLVLRLDSSKGDGVVDYREGPEAMIRKVKALLGDLECFHAIDAISRDGTWITVSQMLTPSTPTQTSYLSVTSKANTYEEDEIQKGIKIVYTYVGTVHSGRYLVGMPKQPDDLDEVRNDIEWAFVFYRYVSRMLGDLRLDPHPVEVVEGGLNGIAQGLQMLKAGMAKAVKFVYKI